MSRISCRPMLAVTLALALSTPAFAHESTSLGPTPAEVRKSLLVRKQRLERACDAMRALAQAEAPRGLSASQLAIYDHEMQLLELESDQCDWASTQLDVVLDKASLDRAVDKSHAELSATSELGELESLRLQMAMDRLSKLLSTLSNLLSKSSDAAQTISQNLK